MYLSCLLINVGDNPDRPRPGRLWLRNLYHVHQRLCMAFPSAPTKSDDPHFLKPFRPEGFGQVRVERGGDAGFLFRIDPQAGSGVVILVQSGVEPDWDYAFHNAAHLLDTLAAPPQVKPFDPFFAEGQRLTFRLRANPTRKIDTKSGPDGSRRNGRRVGIYDEQKQIEWLQRQGVVRVHTAGKAGGFEVLSVQVVPEGFAHGRKRDDHGEHAMKHHAVRFDGVMRVTDPDAFLGSLSSGIGPAKAFGFGLLSVAPVPAVG